MKKKSIANSKSNISSEISKKLNLSKQLVQACYEDNIEKVEELIIIVDRRVNILDYETYNEDKDAAIKEILLAGDSEDDVALILRFACKQNNEHVVERLISLVDKIKDTDTKNQVIEKMLLAGDFKGSPAQALRWAYWNNNEKNIKNLISLVDKIEGVDTKDKFIEKMLLIGEPGSTPAIALRLACYNSNEKVVEDLISLVDKIKNPDTKGKVIKGMLLAKGSKNCPASALRWACDNDDEKIVKNLISLVAKIDDTDITDEIIETMLLAGNSENGVASALRLACYNSNEKVVEDLISLVDKIKNPDTKGKVIKGMLLARNSEKNIALALRWACRNNNGKIVENLISLVDKIDNTDIIDEIIETMLLAGGFENKVAFGEFIETRLLAESSENEVANALSWASQNNNEKIVENLISLVDKIKSAYTKNQVIEKLLSVENFKRFLLKNTQNPELSPKIKGILNLARINSEVFPVNFSQAAQDVQCLSSEGVNLNDAFVVGKKLKQMVNYYKKRLYTKLLPDEIKAIMSLLESHHNLDSACITFDELEKAIDEKRTFFSIGPKAKERLFCKNISPRYGADIDLFLRELGNLFILSLDFKRTKDNIIISKNANLEKLNEQAELRIRRRLQELKNSENFELYKILVYDVAGSPALRTFCLDETIDSISIRKLLCKAFMSIRTTTSEIMSEKEIDNSKSLSLFHRESFKKIASYIKEITSERFDFSNTRDSKVKAFEELQCFILSNKGYSEISDAIKKMQNDTQIKLGGRSSSLLTDLLTELHYIPSVFELDKFISSFKTFIVEKKKYINDSSNYILSSSQKNAQEIHGKLSDLMRQHLVPKLKKCQQISPEESVPRLVDTICDLLKNNILKSNGNEELYELLLNTKGILRHGDVTRHNFNSIVQGTVISDGKHLIMYNSESFNNMQGTIPVARVIDEQPLLGRCMDSIVDIPELSDSLLIEIDNLHVPNDALPEVRAKTSDETSEKQYYKNLCI